MIKTDFSAIFKIRAEKELTCQRGDQASLGTTVVTFGTRFNEVGKNGGYSVENETVSVLTWCADLTQDPERVNSDRKLTLTQLKNFYPTTADKWTTIIEVSDKCAGQYYSRFAARALNNLVQDQHFYAQFGITTLCESVSRELTRRICW